jgi:hypothetical protein
MACSNCTNKQVTACGAGAGGIWGPARPDNAGFSFTGGGIGEPGIIGRGGVGGVFKECLSVAAPAAPYNADFFYVKRPEVGYITQHTFDGRLSQGKTLFAAAGGGGSCNHLISLDHLPSVYNNPVEDGQTGIRCMAGAPGGGSAVGFAGFGAGGGGAVIYRSPTCARWCVGKAGCGGGGGFVNGCCTPTSEFSNPFEFTASFGGSGVGVIEYWTT